MSTDGRLPVVGLLSDREASVILGLDYGGWAVAVSLRGYGASTLAKPLNSCSVADYVDDVRATDDMLGSDPVLIGHSLGGLVVQKYLDESGRAPAAVLFASYPPQRMRRAAIALRAVIRHPWLTIRANTVGTTADRTIEPQDPQTITRQVFRPAAPVRP
jgi:pimeloyl-ACP methyl ester carboxylesterase